MDTRSRCEAFARWILIFRAAAANRLCHFSVRLCSKHFNVMTSAAVEAQLCSQFLPQTTRISCVEVFQFESRNDWMRLLVDKFSCRVKFKLEDFSSLMLNLKSGVHPELMILSSLHSMEVHESTETDLTVKMLLLIYKYSLVITCLLWPGNASGPPGGAGKCFRGEGCLEYPLQPVSTAT